jgi:hypothetical protein
MLYEMTGQTAQHVTALVNLVELPIPLLNASGARWYPAPFDLSIPGADSVQPDLLVVLRRGRASRHRRCGRTSSSRS